MATKQELLEEIRKIEQKELDELIEKQYPKLKALEGKYYKWLNSYSLPKCEEDYWYIYVKIHTINKEDFLIIDGEIHVGFEGVMFQTDIENSIRIDLNHYGRTVGLSKKQEISSEEFTQAWNELLDKLSKVNTTNNQ